MLTQRLKTVAHATVLVYAVILLSPGYAQSQEVRLSVAELKSTSSSVVVARTVKTESYWNADRSAILTRVTLRVEDRILGEAAEETVVIVPGGQIGEYIHEVSDMPSFATDDESVVFIERHSSGVNVVSGGAQGKLDIEVDTRTNLRSVIGGQGLFPDMKLDATPGAAADVSPDGVSPKDTISLDEFKNKIRQR